MRLTGKDPTFIWAAAIFYLEEMLWAEGSDHYRALGVARDDTQETLIENFQALMAWLHPYVGRSAPEGALADRVLIAWEAVKTPELRAAYDRSLVPAEATVSPVAFPLSPRRRSPVAVGALIGLAAIAGIAIVSLVGERLTGPANVFVAALPTAAEPAVEAPTATTGAEALAVRSVTEAPSAAPAATESADAQPKIDVVDVIVRLASEKPGKAGTADGPLAALSDRPDGAAGTVAVAYLPFPENALTETGAPEPLPAEEVVGSIAPDPVAKPALNATREQVAAAKPEQPAEFMLAGSAPVPVAQRTAPDKPGPLSILAMLPGARVVGAAAYRRKLFDHLGSFTTYPENTGERQLSGVPVVNFTVDSGGRVVAMNLTQKSGEPILDEAALASVRRASPFPPIPPELDTEQMVVTVPIRFHQ